jgi:hypothetical protein
MSQVAMTVIDSEGAIHGEPHGSFIDRAVGALAAEPDTIAEFRAALGRFSDDRWDRPLCGWTQGVCEEPYDAGLCIIDLSSRMVFLESTYSHASHSGTVTCRLDDKEFPVSYHVSDDWKFSRSIVSWQAKADARRQERLAAPPIDTREVLYEAVCRFVVDECLAARNESTEPGKWAPPEGWTLRVLPGRAKDDKAPTSEDGVAEIHARWLMTPRADLRDRSPREILLARHDHISFDLQDRCGQWSRMGECPVPLSRVSAAYRYAGFGTHEIVVYYELVRHLAWECWKRVVERQDASRQAPPDKEKEVLHLEQAKQDWLNSPDLEDFSGSTPALVVENERRRIPWAVSGKDAIVDDDCPLCQMMAESMGPGFWHLDGCNMDFDFPFSWHLTLEEWEREQREWADFSREFDEKMPREDAGSGGKERFGQGAVASPWQQSGTSTDLRADPPPMVLFGLACRVAELEQSLKSLPDAGKLVGSVNRHFSNLRDVVDDPSPELIEPVVERFCEQLQSVCDGQPELSEKCADLQRQSREFAAQFSEDCEPEDDVPY